MIITEKASTQANNCKNYKIKGYVINLSRCPERLERFNQNPYAHYFERVSAIDKYDLNKFNAKNLFFSVKLFEKHMYPISTGEIACTLSHILCWEKIAKNNELADDDYAIIAEDDIVLLDDFDKKLKAILELIKNSNVLHEIVILHRLDVYKQDKPFDKENSMLILYENLSPDNINNVAYINNNGSALYLIRKDIAKEKYNLCRQNKPCWLADQFTIFCSIQNIGIIYPYLGKIMDIGDSDLEEERSKNINLTRNF